MLLDSAIFQLIDEINKIYLKNGPEDYLKRCIFTGD